MAGIKLARLVWLGDYCKIEAPRSGKSDQHVSESNVRLLASLEGPLYCVSSFGSISLETSIVSHSCSRTNSSETSMCRMASCYAVE